MQRRIAPNYQGSPLRPRIRATRSLRNISLQAIDDQAKVTLAAASSLKSSDRLTVKAVSVAKELAKYLKARGIDRAIFDRGKHRYAGCVKLVAETLRQEGIIL